MVKCVFGPPELTENSYWSAQPGVLWSRAGYGPGMAGAAEDRLEPAATHREGSRAQRAGDRELEKQRVVGPKTVAARQRRIIVFIDESRLSERFWSRTYLDPQGPDSGSSVDHRAGLLPTLIDVCADGKTNTPVTGFKVATINTVVRDALARLSREPISAVSETRSR
jgi:hypothetical protein